MFPVSLSIESLNDWVGPMQNLASSSKISLDSETNGTSMLSSSYIQMIEEALASLGDYGEVRLVVERGRLRFLITQKSYDILKWQSGMLVKELENWP